MLCQYFIFWWLKFAYFGQDYQDLQRTYLIFNFALPFWEHCALLFWHRYPLPFLYHYALSELVQKLKCSKGCSQATGGLLWFSCGLGGAIFLKFKRNITSDPLPDILEGLLDFVLIFYFSVAQVCMLLTRLSRFAKNIFNLQLCASILGALCASILDTTMRFHFGSTIGKHTSSKCRLKLVQKNCRLWGSCAPSRLWLRIFRQMNNQQSLLLTHLQIKSTWSAATFEYDQISDSHKRNDMVLSLCSKKHTKTIKNVWSPTSSYVR